MSGIRDVVADHELFHGLEPAHVDLVAGFGRETLLPARTTIAREGDPADAFYLLQDGRVALQLAVAGHGAVVIETLGPGDVVGPSWIVPPYRWSTGVVAVHSSEAVAFDGARLRDACDVDPAAGFALARRFAAVTEERLLAVCRRLLTRADFRPSR